MIAKNEYRFTDKKNAQSSDIFLFNYGDISYASSIFQEIITTDLEDARVKDVEEAEEASNLDDSSLCPSAMLYFTNTIIVLLK